MYKRIERCCHYLFTFCVSIFCWWKAFVMSVKIARKYNNKERHKHCFVLKSNSLSLTQFTRNPAKFMIFFIIIYRMYLDYTKNIQIPSNGRNEMVELQLENKYDEPNLTFFQCIWLLGISIGTAHSWIVYAIFYDFSLSWEYSRERVLEHNKLEIWMLNRQ